MFGYSDFLLHCYLLYDLTKDKISHFHSYPIGPIASNHMIIILLVFISRKNGGRYEIHIDPLALQCRMKILQDELLVFFTFRTSFSIQLGLGCHHFTTFTAIFQSIFPVHFHVALFLYTFYHHDAIFLPVSPACETCRTPQYKEVPQRKLK